MSIHIHMRIYVYRVYVLCMYRVNIIYIILLKPYRISLAKSSISLNIYE